MISTRVIPWTPRLLAFAIPSLIGGSVWWLVVQQALRGHVAFNQAALANVFMFIFLGLLSLTIWLAPTLLVAYVGKWRSVRYTAVLAATIPILFFFPWQLWTGLAWLILLLGLWWGMETAADDAHNRLTIQPMRTLPHAMPAVIFGVIIAVSLLYYQQLRASASTAEELSRRLIDQTVTLTERVMPAVYKDYRSDMTVDQLIGAQLPNAEKILSDIHFNELTSQADRQRALEETLSSIGYSPNELNLNLKQSEEDLRRQLDLKLQEFRDQTIDQARQELGERLDVTLKGNETMHEVLRNIIGRQFDRYVRRYVTIVPALLAVALFFILRVATSLFQAVVVWMGWLLLRLYRGLKVLSVTHQTVPAEKLDWGP